MKPWQLTRTRWGWRWRTYSYGCRGIEITGWRPTRRWAMRAAARAGERI